MRIKSNKKIFSNSFIYNFFNFSKPQFSIANYNVLAPLFIFNKTRRLMVARTKRILRKRSVASKVWVKLGRIVFLFKKSLNSRMGKGIGSFFSVRRWLGAGSRLMSFYTKRSGFCKFVLRYIRARVQVPVSLFVLRNKNLFEFREVSYKFKKFKRVKLQRNRRLLVFKKMKRSKKKSLFRRLTLFLWKTSHRDFFFSDDCCDAASCKRRKTRYYLRSSKWVVKRGRRVLRGYRLLKKFYIYRSFYDRRFDVNMVNSV